MQVIRKDQKRFSNYLTWNTERSFYRQNRAGQTLENVSSLCLNQPISSTICLIRLCYGFGQCIRFYCHYYYYYYYYLLLLLLLLSILIIKDNIYFPLCSCDKLSFQPFFFYIQLSSLAHNIFFCLSNHRVVFLFLFLLLSFLSAVLQCVMKKAISSWNTKKSIGVSTQDII